MVLFKFFFGEKVGGRQIVRETFGAFDAAGRKGDGQHVPLPDGRLPRLGRRRGRQRQRLPLPSLSPEQLPHLPGHSRGRQLQGISGSSQPKGRDGRRRQTDQRND